ncbi:MULTISPECIES: hypothetical protein [unclassified Brevundimonas]|jgi:MFS family permease|uniref:hypothetical protein n=1 Tax=unclassified Brevundimonas TaxID=2622653 RepID=UPI000C675123|nr:MULTISPECIES: hypothetical protein [unclassified Brevundimonas]MAL87275.1 hypothetical protein [Brevundimonas sp.]|tara:strand:- start:7804 stop:8706 length:903 start_codon:yes stop_codon:yes gene_type:complete
MTFSATDAAFEGFRVVRRKPMVLLWWAAFYLVSFALIFLLAAGPIAGVMAAASDLENMGPGATPEDLRPFMMAYLAVFPILIPLGILMGAVLNAAVARSVLEPGKSAFGYLRIGMDEVRVAVVSVVLSIVMGLAAMVIFGVAGFIAGFLGAADVPGGALIIVVVFLAAIAAMIWLAVRLSLAIPITVAEKRFAFFDSFKVTGGHLWGLIGMAVIAFVMTLVVSILTSIVFFPLTMGMGAAVDWESLEGMNAMGILQAIGPMVAVAIVLQAISSALLAAVMYAPFAAAYRDLKGTGTPELA